MNILTKRRHTTLPSPPSRQTLLTSNPDWPSLWVGLTVKHMKIEGKSPKTIQNYTRAIRHFTQSFKVHPKNITAQQIGNYLFNLVRDKNYTPRTHNLHVAAIKYFYNTILNDSGKNPALVKKRAPESLFEFLSKDELMRLFDSEKNLRNSLLIKAGYAFGLRVNRAISLRLSDFDFERNLLFIKGDKGKKDRFVPLSKEFVQELNDYVRISGIENLLFPGYGGYKTISSKLANLVLHNTAHKAGITKKISYHTLRRTFATHLHEAGYSLRDIQVLMGHTCSRTTERYTKVSSKHISQIRSPLDEMNFLKKPVTKPKAESSNTKFNKR